MLPIYAASEEPIPGVTAEGLAERVIYRELFPRGLTAVDDLDEDMAGTDRAQSRLAARLEVMGLLGGLNLRLDARGERRAGRFSEALSPHIGGDSANRQNGIRSRCGLRR